MRCASVSQWQRDAPAGRLGNRCQVEAKDKARCLERDRALAAIRHEEVFPVPVDVFENGIYPDLESRLRQHFGLAEADRQPPEKRDGVLEALGASSRRANPLYVGPPLVEQPGMKVAWPFRKAVRNIWGTWDGPESYTDELERPLARAESVADVTAHSWPDAAWFDYERVGVPYMQSEIAVDLDKWVQEKVGYLRIAGGWSPIASRVLDLFGIQTGLMHMADRPDLVEAAVSHITDFYADYYQRLAESIRGWFDVLAFGDDFASQRSMLLSPDSWRRYFAEAWRQLFSIAHRHGLKTMMHSCGAVRPILGDLVDAGLDILEVVQTTAQGMDPAGLKKEFGKDLVFYGGVDVQGLMPTATPEEVRGEVRRLVDTLGVGGGYVLVTSHFMMDDLPLANVVAMYDEGTTYVPSGKLAS